MPMRIRLTFCSLLSLIILASCGHGDRPEIGYVTGKVTLDGEPLPKAVVFFRPQAGGRTSVGITKEDGSYEMTYIGTTLGAKVGKHDVRITTGGDAVDASGKNYYQPEMLPAKYNDKTELSADVAPGDNPPFNWELVGRVKPKRGG